MRDDHNHARAVRILDDQLGRLLADLAAALDDEAWLAAEYFRTYAPRERRLQLVRLWLEWTAQHRGPRLTLPGVIVTRRGLDVTENADGTGVRMCLVAEERAGTYWHRRARGERRLSAATAAVHVSPEVPCFGTMARPPVLPRESASGRPAPCFMENAGRGAARRGS